jgi:hypothetical protein
MHSSSSSAADANLQCSERNKHVSVVQPLCETLGNVIYSLKLSMYPQNDLQESSLESERAPGGWKGRQSRTKKSRINHQRTLIDVRMVYIHMK